MTPGPVKDPGPAKTTAPAALIRRLTDRLRPTTRGRVLAVAVALAVLAAAGIWTADAVQDARATRITAYFPRATGVYEGSDLRILGVRVGSVDAVEPAGAQVRLTLLVDEGVPVPRGAHAVVVAPSVVADRYVQLTPAWTGGPRLRDGAVLPADRNALPLEIDQLYASLTEMATALGPRGANADGALTRLLDVGAKNLRGNGKAIGDSIDQFAKAARTLDRSSGDLFTTLEHLQTFTTMLKENDSTVVRAERQLATVTGFLADDKENLSAALRELGTALRLVRGFIEENRAPLRASVADLVPLTQALVDQRTSLAEALDTAPLAAGNALAAYDPRTRILHGRPNLLEIAPVPRPPAPRRTQPGTLPLPAVGAVHDSTPERGGTR
ncbi:MCE family protein [Streptomyces yaizuensis]|uniref:MCE family protein n=1 Tax=Streptomyces yaizuensis TaxID=2989713 RepID=A0ABQ5P720_9ACTN|nr:MCE family protein [Streptomyces sp. YSPA8]GLF98385.1 MCE family protein [Streptomyces sp. YSPA8]